MRVLAIETSFFTRTCGALGGGIALHSPQSQPVEEAFFLPSGLDGCRMPVVANMSVNDVIRRAGRVVRQLSLRVNYSLQAAKTISEVLAC
jgi:hypothetical protein